MTRRLGPLSLLVATTAMGLAAWLPSPATANPVAGPAPTPGPSGLPDGRVYEQVSPPLKNGNYVLFGSQSQQLGLSSANGNAVIYPANGPIGEAASGNVNIFVSRRTPGSGWQTAATTARPLGPQSISAEPVVVVPSTSFTRFLYQGNWPFVQGDPLVGGGFGGVWSGVNIFVGEDPFVEPEWLGRPRISQPLPAAGEVAPGAYEIAGASPSLNTVYFSYVGTLVEEDASRAPNVALEAGDLGPASRGDSPGGFYEWHEGKLVSAGVLPSGTINPFGAVPAALSRGDNPEDLDNGVSENGERALFVSPAPSASSVTDQSRCEQEPPCSSEAPELYNRETAPDGSKFSVLVSRSNLPEHEGEPAPDGAAFAYASPDGSQVFFTSVDRLTSDAPENTEAKMYDFDVETGSLAYLSAITGRILDVSRDGSEVVFEVATSGSHRLELWQDGTGGGIVTEMAELPGEGAGTVRLSSDGSVAIFVTSAEVPGGFSNQGGYSEVYRYDVSENELSCLSCTAPGVTPTGGARIAQTGPGGPGLPGSTLIPRGMSENGQRVFFETLNALVPQDTNGTNDVYEWENGKTYLISSGAGSEPSFYLDNDATGENVFFSTAAGLVPGDTDGSYDVYDARIPRPGDNLPGATPCKGSVCQGPPSTPELLSAPASAMFSGVGNLTPLAEVTHTSGKAAKRKTRKHKPRRASSKCGRRYRRNKKKRHECESRAGLTGEHHRNRRGK